MKESVAIQLVPESKRLRVVLTHYILSLAVKAVREVVMFALQVGYIRPSANVSNCCPIIRILAPLSTRVSYWE